MAYTDYITSQHVPQPKFNAMVAVSTQPQVDLQALYASVPPKYDVDLAVGTQLDVVGQWVGISRVVRIPLLVYFSFDTYLLGFDQGKWFGPYDPTFGTVTLNDDFYRLVIKTRILNNHWDGTVAQAYSFLAPLYAPLGFTVFITDPSNLAMQMVLVGNTPPEPMLMALLQGGYLDVKPAGVRITGYFYQKAPFFAFDLNTAYFQGFDLGSWAIWFPRSPHEPVFGFDMNSNGVDGFDVGWWYEAAYV